MPDDFDPAEIPPGLLQDYLESTRIQLGTLAGLADRLAAAGDDVATLGQFRREVHKVRGSAGSYGFPEASRLAAGMEETVKDWLAHSSDDDLDRGALAGWFVGRLAEALKLEMPGGGAASRPPAPAETSGEAPPEVIVVEDDAGFVELLEFGLHAHHYRFVSYRNGGEALRDLLALDVGQARPLILLDVDLPGIDGYTIFETLQRKCPDKYRVVFTTVHGSEDEQLRGLEGGALDYLVKPLSLRVALHKVRRWLGR